jgi:hypothetical protein
MVRPNILMSFGCKAMTSSNSTSRVQLVAASGSRALSVGTMSDKLKTIGEKMTKFNVGDVVVIDTRAPINNDGPGNIRAAEGLYGRELTVARYCTECPNQVVFVEETPYGDIVYIEKRFKLVRPAYKWAVGDRVRVVSSGYNEAIVGHEATVVKVDDKRTLIEFSDLPNLWSLHDGEMGDGVRMRWNVWHKDPDDDAKLERVVAEEPHDDLTSGYYEPCSSYRACRDENNAWVVEATRVKVIARCADEDEARRIEQALNETKDNI